MNRFNAEDRAQFYSRGAVGTILRVINGGMAYLFLADSGAKFTARADELAPIGSPDRVAPSSSDARTVFVFQHPHSGGARQRTPSQQQQGNAAPPRQALTVAMRRELKAIATTGEPTDPHDWIGAASLWFHARDRVISALLRRGLIEATESGFALTADGRAVAGVQS